MTLRDLLQILARREPEAEIKLLGPGGGSAWMSAPAWMGHLVGLYTGGPLEDTVVIEPTRSGPPWDNALVCVGPTASTPGDICMLFFNVRFPPSGRAS